MSVSPTGDLLAGRNGGFDECSSNGNISQSVSGTPIFKRVVTLGLAMYGNVFSMQCYGNNIYVLYHESCGGKRRRDIRVFDSSYKQNSKWSVPNYEHNCGIAVANNKVYVPDPENQQLNIYSTDGKLLTSLTHPPSFSKPNHLSACSECSIIISDCGTDQVHKLGTKDDSILWTCKQVKDPRGVGSETNGDVWVWSNNTKSIFKLSSESG